MENYNALENKIIRMEDKLDNLKTSVDDVKKLIEKIDENKADKWVEKAMMWFIGLVMTIVITAMVYLVVKQ